MDVNPLMLMWCGGIMLIALVKLIALYLRLPGRYDVRRDDE